MRRVADQENTKEEETSYALERHSSRMATLLSPPFAKKKVKRNTRRNERRRQEKEPQWESELDFHPSQLIAFEPFIEGFLTFDPRKVYRQLCAVNKLAFPSRKRKKKKKLHFNYASDNRNSKPHSLRQRALIAAAHLTGEDVSTTASVYQARTHPELRIVIDSGASVFRPNL
jgi:hypothetical protein